MKAIIGINSKYIHPAFGAHQIKANCKYNIDLLEFSIKDSLTSIVNKLKTYKLLAFSTYIWNIEMVKQILSLLEKEDLTIVLGGPSASYQFESMFKYKNVKYIIKGEGEESFNELLDYLDQKILVNQVSNLYFLNNEVINYTFDKLPNLKLVKHDYSLIKDFENKICYLESSRGCYFNCSYCLASLEKPVRFFDLEEVKKNIVFLLQNRAKIIKFLDRSFNIDQKRMLEILKIINENDNGYTTFQFEIVGDMLNEEVINYIKTMRKKFIRFEIGIQSTNLKTIKAILRNQNFDKLKTNIEKIKDYVVIHTDLICGLPYEDKLTFKKSFNETFLLFTEELQLGFLKELKGTHISQNKDLYHYVFENRAPYEVISNDFISSEDLEEVKIVEKSLDKFYNYGHFPKTFAYLFQELNLDPYDTFLNIGQYILKKGPFSNFQFDEITNLLYQSLCQINLDKDKLFYVIKQDYLTKNNIKPKIWWNSNISRAEKNFIFQKLMNQFPDLNKDILYKYSKLEKYHQEYFLVTYYKEVKTYFLKTYFAYCGFDCSLCPIFSYKKEDLKCQGCLEGNYHFCSNCDIRTCNQEKGLESCGKCPHYPCEKMEKLSLDSIKILNIIKGK